MDNLDVSEIVGTITSKRKMGGGLVFFVVRQTDKAGELQVVYPPPDPGASATDSKKQSAIFGMLRRGVTARFVCCLRTLDTCSDLTVMEAEVLRVSAEPSAVMRVIENVCPPIAVLSVGEAASALGCNESEMRDLMQLWLARDNSAKKDADDASLSTPTADCSGDDACNHVMNEKRAHLKSAVVNRCRLMKGLPPVKEGRQRKPHLHRRDLEVLESLENSNPHIRPIEMIEHSVQHLQDDFSRGIVNAAVTDQDSGYSDTRGPDELGAAHPSFNLLQPDRKSRRGPALMSEYAHGKKAPQISWFVSQLKEMIRPWSTAACVNHGHTSDQPLLRVLDIGGGRGDLAINVATAFAGNCHVTVVDSNERSLMQGKARASTLGLESQMTWICCGVTDLCMEHLEHVDVVLGLHACGGLTDATLDLVCKLNQRREANRKASELSGGLPPIACLICPCCFTKNPDLVPGDSWIGDKADADVELLTRLAESDDRSVSLRAMRVINSSRLDFVEKSVTSTASIPSSLSRLRLLAFPHQLSLRNIVLQLTQVPA